MEGSPLGSRRPDEQEFNLREWHLRARISRENTNSRRYSASYIRSFREDSRSFRSNFTISSTTSSPGYHLKDEIDPSTYSFTTALKALQARSGYVWECLSPEGFSLSSKWDEAERFISNPLSGEVPMECLSAKTLSGRSFRSVMASRVTMSAPLVFSARHQHRRTLNNSAKPTTTTPVLVIKEPSTPKSQFPLQDEKVTGSRTRDAVTQSIPQEGEEEGSSSPSPASTPSIQERAIRRCVETEDGDTQNSSSSTKLKPVDECVMQVEVKVTREGEETKRRNKEGGKKKMKKNRTGKLCSCRQSSGCLLLSWRSLWMKKRHREKHKLPPSQNQTITTMMSTTTTTRSSKNSIEMQTK